MIHFQVDRDVELYGNDVEETWELVIDSESGDIEAEVRRLVSSVRATLSVDEDDIPQEVIDQIQGGTAIVETLKND